MRKALTVPRVRITAASNRTFRGGVSSGARSSSSSTVSTCSSLDNGVQPISSLRTSTFRYSSSRTLGTRSGSARRSGIHETWTSLLVFLQWRRPKFRRCRLRLSGARSLRSSSRCALALFLPRSTLLHCFQLSSHFTLCLCLCLRGAGLSACLSFWWLASICKYMYVMTDLCSASCCNAVIMYAP